MRRLYFLGVDTRASAVNRLFDPWARLCGLADAALEGLDAPQGAPPGRIREMVKRVADDPDAVGGLVTTHKVAVYSHARDLLTSVHPDAALLGEVGCIVKGPGELEGIAIDHESCGIPLTSLTSGERVTGDVLIFGAGGAGRAIALHLKRRHDPARVIVTDVVENHLRDTRVIAEVEIAPAERNEELLAGLRPGALVINATGLGKDRPGTPLPDAARFPQGAVAWDLNYRGDLRFIEQARAQGARTEDGWVYFVAGWLTVMSHVFDFRLTPQLLATALAGSKR